MDLQAAFGEQTFTSGPTIPSSDIQGIVEGIHYSDLVQDTNLKHNGDFLQLYSQLRKSVSIESKEKNEKNEMNDITKEELDKCHTIILTYRNLKSEHEALVKKYNGYMTDLSKNEILKTEILMTRAKFFSIVHELENTDEDKKKLEESSKNYDDERVDLLTNHMSKVSVKKMELGTKIEKIDEQLGFLRSFFNEILNEVVPVEKRFSSMCSICLETKVNKVLVPCGHTFCAGCITQAETMSTSSRSRKCGICRTSYTQSIHLYI